MYCIKSNEVCSAQMNEVTRSVQFILSLQTLSEDISFREIYKKAYVEWRVVVKMKSF